MMGAFFDVAGFSIASYSSIFNQGWILDKKHAS